MGVLIQARTTTQPRSRLCMPFMAIALALLAVFGVADVTGAEEAKSHSLAVNLEFPDDGLAGKEQLCVALFAGTSPDLSRPPLLSRCLDPGDSVVTYEGLRPGDFSVLLPGPGSELTEERYQGQLVTTNVPADDQVEAFGIDVDVALAPDFAGTTGRVQVNVYGCPAGTNAGSNEADWATECQALAGGVPLTLTGTGSINDAAFRGVTGAGGTDPGRVEFTNVPAGAYELAGDLPENVSDDPALFVESSIDGSLGSLDPSGTLALRPTETVDVNVYLVLDPKQSAERNETVGLSDPLITGGLSAE